MLKSFPERIKKTLSIWKKIGKQFSSPSYVFFSILVVSVGRLFHILRHRTFIRKLKLKIKYRNGIVLYFPSIDLHRFFDLFSILPSDSYMYNFERIFKTKIDFFKNDWLIDMGAHIGGFSLPIYVKNPEIRVLAFEPDPVNFSCLEHSLSENKINRRRFKINNKAVFSHTGRIKFSVGPETTQGSVAKVGFFLKDNNCNHLWVKSISVKEIFSKYKIKRCKLLKIDCEGSEYAIIENTPDNLLNRIENLIIEAHFTTKREPKHLKKYLMDRGFIVKLIDTGEGCVELFCTRDKC